MISENNPPKNKHRLSAWARQLCDKYPERVIVLRECKCAGKKERHHPDYSKPFEIELLCKAHHNAQKPSRKVVIPETTIIENKFDPRKTKEQIKNELRFLAQETINMILKRFHSQNADADYAGPSGANEERNDAPAGLAFCKSIPCGKSQSQAGSRDASAAA